MKFFRELLKALLAILLVFGLAIGAFLLTDHAKSSDLREFCSSITAQRSAQEVIAQANEHGFPVFPPTEKRSVISVLNHRSPFFRYECTITVSNGHVIRAQINAAD